jgi:hypothetical protein
LSTVDRSGGAHDIGIVGEEKKREEKEEERAHRLRKHTQARAKGRRKTRGNAKQAMRRERKK